jgi:dTDP-4-amino-4,6-dideoxy-D-galactose acyltransferase
MTHGAECRLLEWDSDFFGRRIGRVESRRLDARAIEQVRAFARAEKVDCLYYLVDAGDSESIRTAEAAGFRCADVRITRERSLDQVSSEMPSGVELFQEDDLTALQAIARSSHGASRFYYDLHFPRERCDALYEKWISNACTEKPESVLVVRRAGHAVGYLACETDSSAIGTIGLVAVAEGERGHQIGESLVRGSLSWFVGHDREYVRVVSQARNLAAARLYERLGFRTTAVEHWYHLWPSAEENA